MEKKIAELEDKMRVNKKQLQMIEINIFSYWYLLCMTLSESLIGSLASNTIVFKPHSLLIGLSEEIKSLIFAANECIRPDLREDHPPAEGGQREAAGGKHRPHQGNLQTVKLRSQQKLSALKSVAGNGFNGLWRDKCIVLYVNF